MVVRLKDLKDETGKKPGLIRLSDITRKPLTETGKYIASTITRDPSEYIQKPMEEARRVQQTRDLAEMTLSNRSPQESLDSLPKKEQRPLYLADNFDEDLSGHPSRDIPVVGQVLQGLDWIAEKTKPVAEIGGAFIMPGVNMANIGGFMNATGNMISRVAPKLSPAVLGGAKASQATPIIGNTLGGRMATEAIKEASVGVPIGFMQSYGQGKSFGEAAKDAAIGGAIGGVTGGSLSAAGEGVSRLVSRIRRNPSDEVVGRAMNNPEDPAPIFQRSKEDQELMDWLDQQNKTHTPLRGADQQTSPRTEQQPIIDNTPPTTVNNEPIERGFAQTLKSSEKTPQSFKERLKTMYTPQTNEETLQLANNRVQDVETAASYVLSNERYTAEKAATAQRLIDIFNQQGNYQRAVDIAEKVSEEATKAGQAIQALSMFNRLSPEGVLVYAQRMARKANEKIPVGMGKVEVTEDMAAQLTGLAQATRKMTGVQDVSNTVMDILDRVKLGEKLSDADASTLKRFVQEAQQFVKETLRKPKPIREPQLPKDKRVRDNVVSFMNAQELAAKERLKARGIHISSNPLDVWADYAIIGASKIAKGVVKFSDWSEEMIREFGESIRPQLQKIYDDALSRLRDNSLSGNINRTNSARVNGVSEPKKGIDLITENGLTMRYARNTEKSPYLGKTYGQDIEPHGEYMIHDTMDGTHQLPNWEYGEITFKKPLVIEWETTGRGGWKTKLSEKYGGKTGKALSSAIKKDGYDAIVTIDSKNGDILETINLSGAKNKPLIDKLDELEKSARERIQKSNSRLSSTPLDVWADYAVIGAAKMAKGAIKFADWSEQMVKELGENIRPHLENLYERARETFESSTKKVTRQTISQAEKLTDKVIKGQGLKGREADSLRSFAQTVSKLSGDAKVVASQDLQVVLQSLDRPSTLRKISSVQTIGQLLNPKTQVRNALGNELFYRIERLNKYVSTPIDIVRSKLSGGPRTVTFRTHNQGEYWKNFMRGAKAGWNGVNVNGLQTQYDLGSPSFRGKYNPLTYLEKALGASLRSFDTAAYMRAYNETLGEQAVLQLKNEGKVVTRKAVQEIIRKADENMLKIADEYGRYVTFQDNNVISKGLVKLKKGLNLGKDWGAGDLILKYPKTPGALLMRALEYSPAGFVRSASIMARPFFKKEPNTAEVVQALSRAIIGTMGLSGMGYFLMDKGILTGASSKDRDIRELQKSAGQGQYQVNLSALMRFVKSNFDPNAATLQEGDTLYTYDWMQPVSMAISIGANTAKNMDSGEQKLSGLVGTAYNSLEGGLGTLTEQSVLQGIRRAAEGYPGQTVTDKIMDILSDVPASFVPTALNQVRQIQDQYSRETYDPSKLQTSLNRARNRIPGMAQDLPQQYDTLGREKRPYQNNSIFNVTLNPGFVSRYKLTPEARYIVDLINETGDETIAPRAPQKSITIDGVSIKLSGEEYSKLQRYQGEKTREQIERRMGRDLNKRLDKRADNVKDSLTKAGKDARKQLGKEMGR